MAASADDGNLPSSGMSNHNFVLGLNERIRFDGVLQVFFLTEDLINIK